MYCTFSSNIVQDTETPKKEFNVRAIFLIFLRKHGDTIRNKQSMNNRCQPTFLADKVE